MTDTFKSFYKTVGGGEGSRCNYPTRLDLYGKGCGHNCSYCYARSLLEFRKMWNPQDPSAADMMAVREQLDKIPKGTILRLGGMTDCFQPCEGTLRRTYDSIGLMNERRIGYLIVTKGSNQLMAEVNRLDKELAHIQISLTHTSDSVPWHEGGDDWHDKLRNALSLQKMGYDVQIRLSPYMLGYIDDKAIIGSSVHKILFEFLRVNSRIVKLMGDTDVSEYVLKEGGYMHLPLERKLSIVKPYAEAGIEVFVCDDVEEHRNYFKSNVNANPDDCCDLRHP